MVHLTTETAAGASLWLHEVLLLNLRLSLATLLFELLLVVYLLLMQSLLRLLLLQVALLQLHLLLH